VDDAAVVDVTVVGVVRGVVATSASSGSAVTVIAAAAAVAPSTSQ
jgi:hypothetical protein